MKRSVLTVAIVISVLTLFVAPDSRAGSRFNLMTFYPNPDSGRFVHLLDSQTLYQWQFAAGTLLSYGYRPLEERNSGQRIVDRLLEQHVFATIGILDQLELSADLPVGLYDNFIDPDPLTAPPASSKMGIGDVRVLLKGRLLDGSVYPVGVAIVPFVTIPSGKQNYFLGDDGVTGGGNLVVDARIGRYFTVALNAGVQGGESVQFRNLDRGRMVVMLGGGVSINPVNNLQISAEGFTSTPTNHFFSGRLYSPTEAIASVAYTIGNTGIKIYSGGGGGIVRGAGAPHFMGFAGITYKRMTPEYVAKDAERAAARENARAARPKTITTPSEVQRQTMIVELQERCPPPDRFDPAVDDPACPKYYELKEVSTLIIKCPAKPEDYRAGIDDPRCPKVYTLKSALPPEEVKTVYAMAAVDLGLRCPDSPEQYRPGVDDPACPKYYDLKEASTLMAKCPSNPADFNPAVNDPRCSKVYELQNSFEQKDWVVVRTMSESDRDRDTVPDLLDRCPAEPGSPERMGCPAGAAAVEGGVLKTAQPIEFAFNHVEIKKAAVPVLIEVAEAMLDNPGMRLKIEGYADIYGTKRANLSVSRARAERVKDFLVGIGVDPSRLTAVGMGATNFVGSNKTAAGRARNRRVVFVITAK